MQTFNLVIKILVMVFLAISACASVMTIGKERKPITPGVALGSMIFAMIIIYAIIS